MGKEIDIRDKMSKDELHVLYFRQMIEVNKTLLNEVENLIYRVNYLEEKLQDLK